MSLPLIDLAELRAMHTSYMTSTGVVHRSGVLVLTGPCRYGPETGGLALFSNAPADHLPYYRFRFPFEADVRLWDQVVVDGGVWSLTESLNPSTNSVNNQFLAIQLYGPDADGNPTVPVYLRANCVIAIDRYAGGNNGALPASQTTAIPARWQAPSSEMLQALGDSAMPALYVDPSVDLRQGDGVTLSSGVGYPTLPPFLAGRYPVRLVSQTLGAIPMTMAHLDAKVAQ